MSDTFFLALGWSLAVLGYVVGLLLSRMPSSEARSWGDQLIGYSILSAAFLAAVGTGRLLTSFALDVSKMAGLSVWVEPSKLPETYFNIGHTAYTALLVMTGVGMGSALIPVVGPAIANIYSTASILPSMALTGSVMLSYLLAAILVIFVTLAPVVVPVGVALMTVPGGKAKGIGGWLIAMTIALNSVGPLLPGVGLMACSMENVPLPEGSKPVCSIENLTGWSFGFQSVLDIVKWLTGPEGTIIMGMWRFVIGSFAAFSIMSVVMIALSRAIGGVASSLGVG